MTQHLREETNKEAALLAASWTRKDALTTQVPVCSVQEAANKAAPCLSLPINAEVIHLLSSLQENERRVGVCGTRVVSSQAIFSS